MTRTSSTIQPQLSSNPLRPRGEDEAWLDWATDLYAHTLAELALGKAEWEATFGAHHPGPFYLKGLLAQRERLAASIDAHSPPTPPSSDQP